MIDNICAYWRHCEQMDLTGKWLRENGDWSQGTSSAFRHFQAVKRRVDRDAANSPDSITMSAKGTSTTTKPSGAVLVDPKMLHLFRRHPCRALSFGI